MLEKKIDGLVTVRTTSTRLPAKCLLPFGDCNIIEHIIRRAKVFGFDPIVCTSLDKSDDILEQIALQESVRCFRGSLINKLKRWSDCANFFGLKAFHTIDADDPFFDGEEMISSMRLLFQEKLDLVYPSKVSSAGGGSVGFSLTTEVVMNAVKDLPIDLDTEMIWFYFQNVPGLRSIELPNNPLTPLNLRLTLDYQEDYWLLESIRRMLGNFAPRQKIDQLFKDNPDLHRVNWFRNVEWKSAQLAKKMNIKE